MPTFYDEENRLHIKCEECDTEAPPAGEILAGRGLNNMGWHCAGGKYLCPAHAPKRESTP